MHRLWQRIRQKLIWTRSLMHVSSKDPSLPCQAVSALILRAIWERADMALTKSSLISCERTAINGQTCDGAAPC